MDMWICYLDIGCLCNCYGYIYKEVNVIKIIKCMDMKLNFIFSFKLLQIDESFLD